MDSPLTTVSLMAIILIGVVFFQHTRAQNNPKRNLKPILIPVRSRKSKR